MYYNTNEHFKIKSILLKYLLHSPFMKPTQHSKKKFKIQGGKPPFSMRQGSTKSEAMKETCCFLWDQNQTGKRCQVPPWTHSGTHLFKGPWWKAYSAYKMR